MIAKVLTLPDAEKAFNTALIANGKATQAVHDTVVALRANRRAGTHCVKTKATVQKSGSKPWRQKGTGRARAGYFASPVWRGGGVVFGPHPRDYSKTTPKKVRRLALKKAVSERIKLGDVYVVPAISLGQPKTKDLMAWLKSENLGQSVLLVDAQPDKNLLLASNNVPGVEVVGARQVTTEQILRQDKVVLTEAAVALISERLQTVKRPAPTAARPE
jgi:large subunit ribosomal protein L4